VLTVGVAGVADAFANAPAGGASDTWLNNTPNTAPAIASLSDSPDPVNAGASLTLTANGVVDPEGNAVTVAFYRESNAVAGLQVGGDTLLGSDTSGPYSLTITAPVPGSYTYYAQASDPSFVTSNVVSAASTSVTTAPTITSLSDSPDPVAANTNLILTANGVVDPEGDPVTVAFYRETNGIAGLQPASDTQVASDATDPYSVTITAPSPGTYTYYGQAADQWGVTSNVVSTTNTVLIYSPTPGTPNLLSSSDTGSSTGDDLTRLDNSSPANVLRFTVGPTVVGATVRLFADGVEIASMVATATISTVTTNGTVDLIDGPHAITARQTEPGKSESASSNPLTVTIDTTPPAADVVDVSPDPRTSSVSSVAINFDQTVTGFDLSDLTLKRDGGANLLTAGNAPTGSGASYAVPSLAAITNSPGTYVLSVNASGSNIVDAAGNTMAVNASDTWTFLPPWLSASSLAAWNATTKVLTLNGAATVIADPGADLPSVIGDGASAVLTINPASDLDVHFAALNLTSGATATLSSLGASRTAANHRVLVIESGSVTIDTASKLDLTDNDLIVNYAGPPSPASGIEAMVAAGFNAGDWLGKRITSSTAASAEAAGNFMLGVAENASLAVPFGDGTTGPLFAGQSVDGTCVLVKYTHRIDLDLDGLITSNDAAVFNGSYSEGDAAIWSIGDMDYDGLFTSNDAALFNGFYDESLGAV
jgi:hypothetical protein